MTTTMTTASLRLSFVWTSTTTLSLLIAVVDGYSNHEVIRLYDDINGFSESLTAQEDDSDIYDNWKRHSKSSRGYLEVFAQGFFSSSWKRICPNGWRAHHVYFICHEKGYMDGMVINNQFQTNIASRREMISIPEDCNLESGSLQTCFNEAEVGQCLSNVPVYMVCYGKRPDQAIPDSDYNSTESSEHQPVSPKMPRTTTTTATTITKKTIATIPRTTKSAIMRRSRTSRIESYVTDGLFSFIELRYGYLPLFDISRSNNPLDILEIPFCFADFNKNSVSYFCKSIGFIGGRLVVEVTRQKLQMDIRKKLPNITLSEYYCAKFKNFDCIIYSPTCLPAVVDCYLTMSHKVLDLESKFSITFLNNKVHVFKLLLDFNVVADASVYVQIQEKSSDVFVPISNSRIIVTPYGSCWKNNAQLFHRGTALTITRKDMSMALVSCQKLNISVVFSIEELKSTTPTIAESNLSRTFIFALRGKVHRGDHDKGFFSSIYGVLLVSLIVLVMFTCSLYYSFAVDSIGSDMDMYVID